jgi:hypothetical protein
MRARLCLSTLLIAALMAPVGCSKSSDNSNEEQMQNPPTTATDTGAKKSTGLLKRAQAPKPVTIPAGTVITVRLNESLSSKANHAGDSFTGTVAEPISEEGKLLIPDGANAAGTVTDAKAMGHFKGGALLSITLNQISVNGQNYQVSTSASAHAEKGKGKRSAVVIGGGAGLGALIGGLAGGGKGAAIGAAAGAGAGTAGAAFTGNKEIVLPAESAVSFKLLQPIDVMPTAGSSRSNSNSMNQ